MYAKLIYISVLPVIDFILEYGMVNISPNGSGTVRTGRALEHLLSAPELGGCSF